MPWTAPTWNSLTVLRRYVVFLYTPTFSYLYKPSPRTATVYFDRAESASHPIDSMFYTYIGIYHSEPMNTITIKVDGLHRAWGGGGILSEARGVTDLISEVMRLRNTFDVIIAQSL